jgi:hypothetical protein
MGEPTVGAVSANPHGRPDGPAPQPDFQNLVDQAVSVIGILNLFRISVTRYRGANARPARRPAA